MRARASFAAVSGALVMASCGGAGTGSAEEGLQRALDGSSVLLVTLDTTRADALGCYGGPAWLTPNLDELAEQGVRFESARSPSPMTLPSHTSILTGLYPFQTGVRDNGFRLPDDVTTLPERLREAGYSTAAVLSSFVLDDAFGLAQGFDVYASAPRLHVEVDGLEDQRTAEETVREALRIARAELEPPFFLWVHFFDPHLPYDPREPYYGRLMAGAAPRDLSPGEHDRRVHLSEVAYMDAHIGQLVRELRGLDAQLLTAVVADHGESLGEHGESTHGALLFDSSIRVPLILNHPRLPAGTVVEEPVSSVDLTPTLLDLLGLEPGRVSGASLATLIDGGSAGPTPERPLYFESCNTYYGCGWSPLYGVLLGEFKVIDGPAPLAFRVSEDPSELADVSASKPELLREARRVFRELAPSTVPAARFELADDEQSQLQALGYLAGASSGEEVDPLVPGHLDPEWRDPVEGMPVMNRFMKAFSGGASSPEELLRTVRESLAAQPDNPYFLTYATTAFMSVGQPAEALRTARRSLELRDTPNARCYEAVALNALGRKAEALSALELNTQLHPYHLHTRVAISQLLLEQQRPEEALEHIDFFLDVHDAEDDWHGTIEGWKARAQSMLAGER